MLQQVVRIVQELVPETVGENVKIPVLKIVLVVAKVLVLVLALHVLFNQNLTKVGVQLQFDSWISTLSIIC